MGIERVTTKQAAAELLMDLDTLQYMMRKNRLPIGNAVIKDGKKRWSYYIYRGLLDDYKNSLSGMSGTERMKAMYGNPIGEKNGEESIHNNN